jgi:hypothetical protein
MQFQAVLFAPALFAASLQTLRADPLPSWNDTSPKKALIEFVAKTTRKGSPDFVPTSGRIAVFDNDGTLWCEQPIYVQALFVVDRIKQLSPQHPEWRTNEPYAAALQGDVNRALAGGVPALTELLMATHAGMTSEAFEKIALDWLATARHPKTGKPFTEMVYQPMLELLAFLRAQGFKTYVVSGGGVEFIRPWAERVYGIPPEQVIGSSIKTKYQVLDGKPGILRLPEVNFINDKAGKPVGIYERIGRRPLLAFGNSDGDFEMLEWTTGGPGERLGLILHHNDAAREFAYDREARVGRLARGLDEGPKRGWLIVSMKDDWKRVFAFEKR